MATRVFGVEISLEDHLSLASQDTSVGLYNVTSALNGTQPSGNNYITVVDGSSFSQRDIIRIRDDNNEEINYIVRILGNILYLMNNLSNTYQGTLNGKADGNSRFRWIQNTVSGVSNWNANMIVENGIMVWSRNIDILVGGEIATGGTGGVTVKNTNQFQQKLSDESIYLNGCHAIIFEFEDSTKLPKWHGICEQPTWDATRYEIRFRGMQNKRRSNLSTIITAINYPDADEEARGQVVPLTFGKHLPKFDTEGNIDYNSYTKFLRIGHIEEVYRHLQNRVFDSATNIEFEVADDYMLQQSVFPIVGDSISSDLTIAATGGQKIVHVEDGSKFSIGDLVYLKDTSSIEGGEIQSISVNQLTMKTNLGATYDPARYARVFQLSDSPEKYLVRIYGEDGLPTWKQNGIPGLTGQHSLDYFVGKYIKVVENNQSGNKTVGKYRKITAATVNLDSTKGTSRIELTIDTIFSSHLRGNWNGSDSEQTWISFYTITNEYECDVWPCKDYLDIDGTAISRAFYMTSYQSKKIAKVTTENTDADIDEIPITYERLPQYAYDDSGDGDKNRVVIVAKLFEGNPSYLTGYIIKPPASIEYYGDSTELGTIDPHFIGLGFVYVSPGFWRLGGTTWSTSGSIANIMDKYSNTYLRNILFHGVDDEGIVVLKIFPPEFPTGYKIKKTYLLFMSNYDSNSGFVNVYQRRFIGAYTQIANIPLAADLSLTCYPTSADVSFLPDFYFLDNPPRYDKPFYFNLAYDCFRKAEYGHEKLEMPSVTNEDLYRAINHTIIMWNTDRDAPAQSTTFLDICEIAFVFERSIPLGRELYSPMAGRVFNDTWLGRKTSTDMMSSPLDLMEHVSRLQNYSDVSDPPSSGIPDPPSVDWGKNYAENALINVSKGTIATSGVNTITTTTIAEAATFRIDQRVIITDGVNREEATISSISLAIITMDANLTYSYTSGYIWAEGSFEDEDLKTWADLYSIARVITDRGEAYSDSLKRSVCRDLFLINWIDKNGFESVKRLIKETTNPSDALTLADIIDRTSIKITEPNPSEVFPEPFVDYQYSIGAKKNQEIIRFINSGASTYNSNYVEGISSPFLAEEYWNQCNELYKRVHEIGKFPKDLSELLWANGEDADAIAEYNIATRISWMFNPRIQFKVHYTTAHTWEEGHEFSITLPHQTDGVTIECILFKAEFNPNPPYLITIDAIMKRETIPEEFDIQDVMNLFGDDRDWQDTTTEYGDNRDKLDQM
jgi:hypothetical protein